MGPDALDTQGWQVPGDGPDFLHELIEMLKSKHPINGRRVYLFGHSAGAIQALQMSLLEPEYFAAVAVHAGALPSAAYPLMERANRKIPIAIFVGTNDQYFPLPIVRATRDALNSRTAWSGSPRLVAEQAGNSAPAPPLCCNIVKRG